MKTLFICISIWLIMAAGSTILRMVQKMPPDPMNSFFVAPFAWLGVLFSALSVLADRIIQYLSNRFKRD